MNLTNTLLDRYKERKNLGSDAKLARALGLKPSSVSNYRQGVRHAEPETVRLMARELGEDEEICVLKVQAEREVLPERRQVWLRCIARLSTAATAAVVFYAIFSRLDVQTAGLALVSPVYIMRNIATRITVAPL